MVILSASEESVVHFKFWTSGTLTGASRPFLEGRLNRGV